jgi:predicted  nucleic acid-binding Zn-ribbon protein
MPTSLEQLATVQAFDSRIIRMKKELDDIPAREEDLRARNGRQQEALSAAKDRLKLSQAKAQGLESETESEQLKIVKLREQQMLLKTNKEFKAMDSEIATVNAKIAKIEESELILFDEIDGIQGEVKGAEVDLADAEKQTQVEIEDMHARLGDLEQEVGGLTGQRQAATEGIDAAWLKHYDSILANRGDQALVRVEHGVCGGCHMKLTPHEINATRTGETLVSCSFCGRLIY